MDIFTVYNTECPYCTIKCPLIDKTKCPAKMLRDRVEEMEIKAELEQRHIVNLERISQN